MKYACLLFVSFLLLATLKAPAVEGQQELRTPSQLRAEANARSLFRLLRVPEDAILKGSSARSGSGDHDEWYQRLETELSGLEVLRFYVRQLEARGWVRGSEISEGSVAFQTFRFKDDEGRAWHGLLYCSESPSSPGLVTLLLRQTRLAE